MINDLLNIRSDEGVPELCQRLGNYLGLPQPVPRKVLLRAIEDPVFAQQLAQARKQSKLLQKLLNDPRNEVYSATPLYTNVDLIKKAASAFIRWGKAGFSVVDQATLERRELACMSCPNLSVPKKFVQKLMAKKKFSDKPGQRLGPSFCQQCGCSLARKIKLVTESCPDQHPTQRGMTRWEEPMKRRSSF